MMVKKRLLEFEPNSAASVDSDIDKWKLEGDTILKELEKRLASFTVHTEYFRPTYKYRRNQDGKEYRYNFNSDVPKFEW